MEENKIADITISQTIPEAKVAKALQGYLVTHPNRETIDDPEWIDPNDGTPTPQLAKYTDKQWFQENQDRLLRADIHRGLTKLAMNIAKNEVVIDDEIIS